ncbi:MAG: disulfide bond formation protein B [Pseudorhodobacter sp.]|nr:disulfide bond formation protein B [Pseudorhodobacter sp.]
MTRRTLIFLAAGGSLAVLLGAFAFQHLGGVAPCELCLLQRWPHAAAVLIGLVALIWPFRGLACAGAVAALATAGLAVYHSGVERRWWEGPSTCTSGSTAGVSAEDLLNRILATPVVRCDEISWDILGLSLANLNVAISVGLAMIWIAAARR